MTDGSHSVPYKFVCQTPCHSGYILKRNERLTSAFTSDRPLFPLQHILGKEASTKIRSYTQKCIHTAKLGYISDIFEEMKTRSDC